MHRSRSVYMFVITKTIFEEKFTAQLLRSLTSCMDISRRRPSQGLRSDLINTCIRPRSTALMKDFTEKTLRQKNKMLVTSIFFLYQHFFSKGFFTLGYGGTKVTWKIYFILRAHVVANTCARNKYYVRTQ